MTTWTSSRPTTIFHWTKSSRICWTVCPRTRPGQPLATIPWTIFSRLTTTRVVLRHSHPLDAESEQGRILLLARRHNHGVITTRRDISTSGRTKTSRNTGVRKAIMPDFRTFPSAIFCLGQRSLAISYSIRISSL